MDLVGYHIARGGPREFDPSPAYDYTMARGGLYVEAISPHLYGRIRIGEAEVRGLPEIKEVVALLHGKVPRRLWDLAVSLMLVDPRRELYLAMVWAGDAYSIRVPEQTVTGASVRYEPVQDAVVEIHSHGSMGAFFSSTDDADEQSFRIYAVVGKLHTGTPEAAFRLGVYGYRMALEWGDVFSEV
jgi:PRTRC genetic system protein A